jgi:hypothetical protein
VERRDRRGSGGGGGKRDEEDSVMGGRRKMDKTERQEEGREGALWVWYQIPRKVGPLTDKPNGEGWKEGRKGRKGKKGSKDGRKEERKESQRTTKMGGGQQPNICRPRTVQRVNVCNVHHMQSIQQTHGIEERANERRRDGKTETNDRTQKGRRRS